jgi:hypothetical protein
MLNPAWAARTGAQPWTWVVSRREPLWKPAVRESPRKMVLEKLPAFFACWAWSEASCFEALLLPLSLLQAARGRRSAAVRLECSRTERLFIFMATNGPLGEVADLGKFATVCAFCRRGFVSHSGCDGEQEVFGEVSAGASGDDRIGM